MTVASSAPLPLRFLWWGMVAAVFVYAALILFFVQSQSTVDAMLPQILIGVATVQVVVAQVLWARLKSSAAGLSPAELNPRAITVWALDEGPAVIGFVIHILGGPQWMAFTLFGMSLIALLLNPFWSLDTE